MELAVRFPMAVKSQSQRLEREATDTKDRDRLQVWILGPVKDPAGMAGLCTCSVGFIVQWRIWPCLLESSAWHAARGCLVSNRDANRMILFGTDTGT